MTPLLAAAALALAYIRLGPNGRAVAHVLPLMLAAGVVAYMTN